MPNIWTEFKSLLPSEAVTIGTVLSHNADGTSTIEFINGERIRPIGQGAAVGQKALVQKGKVIGEAPALTQYDVSIP